MWSEKNSTGHADDVATANGHNTPQSISLAIFLQITEAKASIRKAYNEVFYRQFANRRDVAAYVGLTPSLFASGDLRHDQGISKAGNPRARATMVELAWLWVRHQ